MAGLNLIFPNGKLPEKTGNPKFAKGISKRKMCVPFALFYVCHAFRLLTVYVEMSVEMEQAPARGNYHSGSILMRYIPINIQPVNRVFSE